MAEAKRLFDQASPRPNAKKVLVVIMDKKSTDTEEDIQEALNPLKEDDVKIVPVAIGPDADVNELKNITSAEGYLVEAEKTTDPKKLAEKIMAKVTSGMRVLKLLYRAILTLVIGGAFVHSVWEYLYKYLEFKTWLSIMLHLKHIMCDHLNERFWLLLLCLLY